MIKWVFCAGVTLTKHFVSHLFFVFATSRLKPRPHRSSSASADLCSVLRDKLSVAVKLWVGHSVPYFLTWKCTMRVGFVCAICAFSFFYRAARLCKMTYLSYNQISALGNNPETTEKQCCWIQSASKKMKKARNHQSHPWKCVEIEKVLYFRPQDVCVHLGCIFHALSSCLRLLVATPISVSLLSLLLLLSLSFPSIFVFITLSLFLHS